MRKNAFRSALVGGAALLMWGASTPVVAQNDQALVIQGGTLIDGNGGAPVANSVVVMQGNHITAVGRAGQVQVPAGARVINAEGKYVLPGLWDGQVNYAWFWGELMLNQGVTTTVDIGDGEETSIAQRDGVARGKIVGPRHVIGIGHIGGIRGDVLTGLESPLSTRQNPKSAEDARAIAKRFLAAGADMVMFHDGSYPIEYYQAGCDEAHKANKPCTLRATGPKVGVKEGVTAGADWIPHANGVAQAVVKEGSEGAKSNNDLDRFADVDDAKAKDLIQFLVAHHTVLVPTIVHNSPSYPKGWDRYEAETRKVFSDPNLLAYYGPEYLKEMWGTYERHDEGAVRDRRMKGYQNMLRFYKMFDAAGGHTIAGGDTNGGKAAGLILHDEMEAFQEAGIPQMHIIQGATKWTAEAMHMAEKGGTIEAGKNADVLIVNADPLKDIANLRNIDTVVFDGHVADRTFHAWYDTPFGGVNNDVSVVEELPWTVALKRDTFRAGGGGGGGQAPDPVASPQPAIETIMPAMIAEGSPTTTVTLKGFNFVRRTRVYFDGMSVPYQRVSPTELRVTLDEDVLRRPGRFDLVVKNPAPLDSEQWGDGTSNKGHLIVSYK